LIYSHDRLIRERDELLRELETLGSNHEQGTITDKDYQVERNRIERAIVAVMDRITQTNYLSRTP
jgi:hypothetical protein